MLVTIELIVFVLVMTLAILWVRDPSGTYEPWIVLAGFVFTGVELLRRFQKRTDSATAKLPKEQELLQWLEHHGAEKPLSQVLPRALQFAQLLGDKEFEHWLRMELYGYSREGGMTQDDTVPEYREITGRYFDNYDRMVHIADPRLTFVNGYRLRFGVRQLEEIARRTELQNIRDEEFIEILRDKLNLDVFRFGFSPIEVVGVLDRIRNRLLERISTIHNRQRTRHQYTGN